MMSVNIVAYKGCRGCIQRQVLAQHLQNNCCGSLYFPSTNHVISYPITAEKSSHLFGNLHSESFQPYLSNLMFTILWQADTDVAQLMTGSFVYNPNTCHRVRFRHSISSGDGGALRLWLLTDSGTYQVTCSTLQVLYSTMSNDLELQLFLLPS